MSGGFFLTPGDPAPRFQAPTSEYPVFHFDQSAGRYVVLSFFGTLQNPEARRSLAHMTKRHHGWFDGINASFFGVGIDPAEAQTGALQDEFPGIRYFRDFDGAVSKLYGVLTPNPDGGGRLRFTPVTLVFDPMLRLFAVIAIDAQHDAVFDNVVAALSAGQGRASLPAPVLILPRVFEPEFCARLIGQFGAGATLGAASGVMEDIAGRTTEVIDAGVKRRRDVFLKDAGLQREVRERFERRLLPAIQQAFQFRVTSFERYLLARYDGADGGFFAAHRDDTTLGTAHRRFAVTVNLNADYEGGDLMFPEFGLNSYRAPLGGAAVFSCSLLHLVTPMTRGRRFAFLPFLHDDPAEALRNRNLKFLSGETVHRDSSSPDQASR